MTLKPTTLSASLFFPLLLSAVALFQRPAAADLYTATAVSIEWKVDSADEIYLATVARDPGDANRFRFEPWEALKAGSDLRTFPHHTVRRCWLAQCLKPSDRLNRLGTEWLIFVRGRNNDARISAAVNLSHPKADWVSAAITASKAGDQRVLTSKAQILSHVRNRLQGGSHHLSEHCDRDLTDELVSPTWRLPLACWIGAELISVSIDVWDNDNEFGQDFDTWINYLLIPQGVEHSTSDARDKDPLNDALAGRPEWFQRHFKHPQLTQAERGLIGTWRAARDDHILTVTLHPHKTLLFKVEAKPGGKLPPAGIEHGHGFGAGTWTNFGNRLVFDKSMAIDDRQGRLPDWTASVFTAGKFDPNSERLRRVTKDTLEFANGEVFERQRVPLRSIDHPHHHPWYLLPRNWADQ